jgi:ABC-type multidrug transport system fused ATPase/permease subunit
VKTPPNTKSLHRTLSIYFWANGIASVILSLLELALAYSIQMMLIAFKLIDTAQHDSFLSRFLGPISLSTICYLLLGIALIRFIFESIIVYTNTALFEETVFLLRSKLIPSMLFSTFFPASKANHYNGTLFMYASLYLSYLLQFSSLFVLCASMILFMALINYKLTLLSLFLISLIGLITKNASARVRAWTNTLPAMNQKINEYIQKISSNFILIQLLQTQRKEKKTLSQQTHSILRHNRRASLINSLNVSSTSFLGIFIIVAIIYFSQRTFDDDLINIIPFLYFFMRLVQFLSPLVLNFASMSQRKQDYIEANNFYTSSNIVYSDQPSDLPSAQTIPTIEVKDLSFQYPNTDKALFSNMNVELKPGESLGIHGKSGSGKSTLIHILLNLEENFQGSITYDGIPIKDYFNKNKLNIGYVGANSFLFEGTIRDNVLYGNSEVIQDEDILKVFHNLHLSDIVSHSADLDKQIREDASNYSMGQKQRICIARALLNCPQLLILDEYTSNLDQETEESIVSIIKNLADPKPTIIGVSHRVAAIDFMKKKVFL